MPPKILKFDILNFQQTSAFASFYFPAKLSSICSAPTNKETKKQMNKQIFLLLSNGKHAHSLLPVLLGQDGGQPDRNLQPL